MASSSGISWTDSTFNPWIGCTKVGPGCDHCYAERDFDIRKGRVKWGAGNPRSRTSAANWKLPERWNAETFYECGCRIRGTMDFLTTNAVHQCGLRFYPVRRRVFCSSLADVFDNEVPIEWLVDLLDLIRRTPNLDWLLLTKRIGNVMKRLREAQFVLANETPITDDGHATGMWVTRWVNGRPPGDFSNIWMGATVVNQEEVDRDIQKLLNVPARVRFLSMEPLLGAVDLSAVQHLKMLDWIIVGGESGPHARPMHPDWVRSLRDQCQAAGVPFHFKQWGEWTYVDGPMLSQESGMALRKVGKKAAGRLLDGYVENGFPVW